MEDSRAELKAGIVILVSLGMLVTLLVAVGKFKLSKMTTITVRFKNIKGLRLNDPVRYAGVEIGKVKGIDVIGRESSAKAPEVVITLRVEEAYPMRTDSTASIVTTITGANSVEIEPGRGDVVKGKREIQGEEIPSFTEIAKQVNSLLGGAKEIMKNLQTALGPEQAKRFRQILDNINGILEDNRATLRKAISDAGDAIANIRSMIEKDRPALDKTIAKFPGLAERLEDILTKAQAAVDDGKKMLATASKMMDENRGTIHETIVTARDMATNLLLISEDLVNHPWKLLNPTVKDARSADLAASASQVRMAAQYLSAAIERSGTPNSPSATEMKQILDNLKAATSRLQTSLDEVNKGGGK